MLELKITWQDWALGFCVFYIILVFKFQLLKMQKETANFQNKHLF